MIPVKICGIKTPEILIAAVGAGARFVGFVFYAPSSRAIEVEQARELVRQVPAGLHSVGLFVNPSDHELERVLNHVPLDMLQLHGEEAPQRVAEIRLRYELPVIKAISIALPEDVTRSAAYEEVADWLLFDTKAPEGVYGGTGQSFDWIILKERSFTKPWMLSGGLKAENIGQALKLLQPNAVDVSSGVEVERGVKDPVKIKTFIDSVNGV